MIYTSESKLSFSKKNNLNNKSYDLNFTNKNNFEILGKNTSLINTCVSLNSPFIFFLKKHKLNKLNVSIKNLNFSNIYKPNTPINLQNQLNVLKILYGIFNNKNLDLLINKSFLWKGLSFSYPNSYDYNLNLNKLQNNIIYTKQYKNTIRESKTDEYVHSLNYSLNIENYKIGFKINQRLPVLNKKQYKHLTDIHSYQALNNNITNNKIKTCIKFTPYISKLLNTKKIQKTYKTYTLGNLEIPIKLIKPKTKHNFLSLNPFNKTFFKEFKFKTSYSGFSHTVRTTKRHLRYSIFVIKNTGLFIINNTNTYGKLTRGLKHTYLYKLRKKYYSFIKPNQVKNSILRRKSSVILFNNVYASDTGTILFKQLFFKKILSKSPNINKNITLFKNNNATHSNLDIKIHRIKFKPGYQRVWREARSSFKDLMGIKFLYQHQLTKFIHLFLKKTNQKSLLSQEMTLDKILIYSRIVPDYTTFMSFFNSDIIYINGKKPIKRDLNCVLNDFIQVVVSKWYYIFYRWLLNWNILRSKKIKRLLYRKGLSTRYTIMKTHKQRSQTIPDWVFNSRYDFSDIKSFLEVDYFSLSTFIIYDPYVTFYYSPTKLLYPKTSIYRLYNWKYIT